MSCKSYNARRDKVNQGWCHLSDQRPAHTKVPEDAGLLDSLLLPTPRGISPGTQLPLDTTSFNSFQRKGAGEINARRRQGVQPHRSERLQGGGQPPSPTASFHTSTYRLPATHAAERATVLGDHGNHYTPDRVTGNRDRLTMLCPFRSHHSLSFKQAWGTRGPCRRGTELKFPTGGAGHAGARRVACVSPSRKRYSLKDGR